MNKKAQAMSIVMFLILGLTAVFAIYLTAVPLAKVWDDVSAELKSDAAFGTDNVTVENIEKIDSLITPAFDQFVLVSLFAIVLGLMVAGVFFSDHPVFVVFIVLGVIIAMIIGSQFVNVVDEIGNDPILGDKADEFTLSKIAFGKQLPIIILVAGALAILIMLNRRGAPA